MNEQDLEMLKEAFDRVKERQYYLDMLQQFVDAYRYYRDLSAELEEAIDLDFFTEVKSIIYKQCLGVLRDPDWAQDATQDILIKLRKSMPDHEPYLKTIAKNHCIDLLRKYENNTAYLEDLSDEYDWEDLDLEYAFVNDYEPSVEDYIISKEQEDYIYSLVEMLPEKQKEACRLALQGLEIEEIAESLGISYNACQKRLNKANKRLQVLSKIGLF